MAERYPGYDVMKKRNSPSWNEQTRRMIDRRLAVDPDRHRFFTDEEWPALRALCDRIIPQTVARPRPVPLAAMIDEKMLNTGSDGYRYAEFLRCARRGAGDSRRSMPRRKRATGAAFTISGASSRTRSRAVHHGDVKAEEWRHLPPQSFFTKRVLHDIVSAYYSHPTAWNEIGFGGPASPRGYVRMYFDRRDPWEASEARPGSEARARRENARVG